MFPFVRIASAWPSTAPFSFSLTFNHINSVTHQKTLEAIYINFFSLRPTQVCYTIKIIPYLLHNLKIAVSYMLSTFYLLLFIYFFFCLYRVSHDPVVGLRQARGAAGGGGPAVAPPPGPRFHPPSSLINGIKYSYSAFASR